MSALRRAACLGLVLGAVVGCASLRPAATPRRAAVGGPACDTARAVAAVRANLVGAWSAIRAGSGGAATNAYDAATRTAPVNPAPSAGAPQPGGNATTSATSAAIRETQTSVAIWSAEAAHGDDQAAVVRDQIVRLDARARGLPTVAACEAAGSGGTPQS